MKKVIKMRTPQLGDFPVSQQKIFDFIHTRLDSPINGKLKMWSPQLGSFQECQTNNPTKTSNAMHKKVISFPVLSSYTWNWRSPHFSHSPLTLQSKLHLPQLPFFYNLFIYSYLLDPFIFFLVIFEKFLYKSFCSQNYLFNLESILFVWSENQLWEENGK